MSDTSIRLLRLPIAVGVLLTAVGLGTLVDGDVPAGLAMLAAGLLLAGVPAALLARHVRAALPAGTHPSSALADPALRRSFHGVGAGLVAYSVPWFAAAFALLVALYGLASDDGASAGAIAGVMVLASLFAAVPAVLGYGFLRTGRLLRRGVTDVIERAVRLGWLVVVLGGLTTLLSIADDRPAYRGVAAVAGCLVAAALFNNLRLRSLDARVTAYEARLYGENVDR
jgi:hypothetical protein